MTAVVHSPDDYKKLIMPNNEWNMAVLIGIRLQSREQNSISSGKEQRPVAFL
jgi:hypothetical protein